MRIIVNSLEIVKTCSKCGATCGFHKITLVQCDRHNGEIENNHLQIRCHYDRAKDQKFIIFMNAIKSLAMTQWLKTLVFLSFAFRMFCAYDYYLHRNTNGRDSNDKMSWANLNKLVLLRTTTHLTEPLSRSNCSRGIRWANNALALKFKVVRLPFHMLPSPISQPVPRNRVISHLKSLHTIEATATNLRTCTNTVFGFVSPWVWVLRIQCYHFIK